MKQMISDLDDAMTQADQLTDMLFSKGKNHARDQIDTLCDLFLSSDDSVDNAPSMAHLQKLFSDIEMPQQPWKINDYLGLLGEQVLPHSSHLTAPTYIGHMTSPLPGFIRQLSKLVMVMNQNMMKMESCRGLSFLERQVLAMLHQSLFRRDDDFYQQVVQHRSLNLGCFTSGGTIANITAMWVALRRWKQRHEGTQQADACREAPSRGVIIGSQLLHYSFDKAADLIGLRLIRLPVTDQYQLSLSELDAALKACDAEGEPIIALVGIAGTTDFGSVDPLHDLANIARERDIFFHVDAAWGGPMVLCGTGRALLDGIEKADSITIDGHKQLMTPMGCGILLTAHPEALQMIRQHAPYAIRETSLDQGRFTLEGSRPAMALYIHAAFHLLGRDGYSLLMEASLARTQVMAAMLREHAEFELVHQPRMNLLVFRYLPASMQGRTLSSQDNDNISAFNTQLQKRQRTQGSSFVSRTCRSTRHYEGQPLVLLRAVLLNPLTRKHHLQQVIDDLLGLGLVLETELFSDNTVLEVSHG
ncbi:MAG: hypothetical protein OFPII_03820 [Osedax symbiont Rs1]|nr:MAG: hypothetical protein OFPII_03820 [Osedax symbiont Rs1]